MAKFISMSASRRKAYGFPSPVRLSPSGSYFKCSGRDNTNPQRQQVSIARRDSLANAAGSYFWALASERI